MASDPTRADLVQEVDRFHRKVSAGAHLTMTQPIFDPALWQRFFDLYEERHGPFPVPVLIGVLPLQSHRHASSCTTRCPASPSPRLRWRAWSAAGAEGRKEGVKMAQELLLELMELPKVQGVYLMPSFGRYEVACEVLDVVKDRAADAAIAHRSSSRPDRPGAGSCLAALGLDFTVDAADVDETPLPGEAARRARLPAVPREGGGGGRAASRRGRAWPRTRWSCSRARCWASPPIRSKPSPC